MGAGLGVGGMIERIIKDLQNKVDHLAEAGSGTFEMDFDDLNGIAGVIELLQIQIDNLKKELEVYRAIAERK
jgi:hypothetical protein